MTKTPAIAEESFRIGYSLRSVFLGIEKLIDRKLDPTECERVIQDNLSDTLRTRYHLHQCSSWVVTGWIDPNKRDSIRLKIVWLLQAQPIPFGDAVLRMAQAARTLAEN